MKIPWQKSNKSTKRDLSENVVGKEDNLCPCRKRYTCVCQQYPGDTEVPWEQLGPDDKKYYDPPRTLDDLDK